MATKIHHPETILDSIIRKRLYSDVDLIAYPIYRYGGGIDGRDPSDEGGICSYAFSKTEAEEQKASIWGGARTEPPIIVNIQATLHDIRDKLTQLEWSVLNRVLMEESNSVLEQNLPNFATLWDFTVKFADAKDDHRSESFGS